MDKKVAMKPDYIKAVPGGQEKFLRDKVILAAVILTEDGAAVTVTEGLPEDRMRDIQRMFDNAIENAIEMNRASDKEIA